MNEIKKLKKEQLIEVVIELHKTKEQLEEQMITGAIAAVVIGVWLGMTIS